MEFKKDNKLGKFPWEIEELVRVIMRLQPVDKFKDIKMDNQPILSHNQK